MSKAENIELKSANDNPWYLLATLHGEQDGKTINEELQRKNRITWNRWFSEALNDENRQKLLSNGIPEYELTPFTSDEKEEVAYAYISRAGKSISPPSAEEIIDFSYTIFECDTRFNGYFFAHVANFERTKFIRTVHFRSSDFSLFYANFSEATFSAFTTFDETRFCSVDFNSSVFSEEARFRSTTFLSSSFNSTTFSSVGSFESAIFIGSALFRDAAFSCSNFRSCTFHQNAHFSNAIIASGADFNSATFSEFASFDSAILCNADFNSTSFTIAVDFSSAKFTSIANFASTKFRGLANFFAAIFSEDAIFRNSEFDDKTTFANARFETNVPDFRGAQLHEATEWHGVSWPPVSQNKDSNQNQVYAYERLKQEMERLKKHEDEQFFFRKELRVRRELFPQLSFSWLLNFSYESFGDYGYSIAKPIFWIAATLLFGSISIWLVSATTCNPKMLGQAVNLNFLSIFSIFPITGKIVEASRFADLSALEEIIAIVQSIFGTLLFFLLGLALRNRFRMK